MAPAHAPPVPLLALVLCLLSLSHTASADLRGSVDSSPPPGQFSPPPRKAPPPSSRRITPTDKGTASAPAAGGGGPSLLSGGDCPDAQRTFDRINYFRAKHGVPSLEWSTSLARASQEYAEELADKGCRLSHEEYGECLQRVQAFPAPDDSCAVAIDAWYDEINYFDFKARNLFRDNWSNTVGHFTQVIWKSSTEVGCGVASKPVRIAFPGGGRTVTGGCKVIVCRFLPYGNVASDEYFRNNVFAPIDD